MPAPNGEHLFLFESAYWRPEPAFAYASILKTYATASADISDGVMADVAHISNLCESCAVLNFDALPFSMGAESWAEAQDNPIATRQSLASYGDDYGLVFTAKAASRQAIFDTARKARLKLTLVGALQAAHEPSGQTASEQTSSRQGSVCLDVEGQDMAWPKKGYRHK